MGAGLPDERLNRRTDEKLLQLAAAGDEEAFGEFCVRSLPSMLNTFQSECKLSGVPTVLAEDAVQTAIVESILYIRNHKPSEITRGLIYVIARRALWRLIRQEHRMQSFSRKINQAKTTTYDVAATVDFRLMIREAFHMLPEKDQQLLTAVLFDGLSKEYIASELGITIENFNKRYYRAIVKLREFIGDNGL